MFVPNSFTDGSAGGTPITAATLNNLENGLVAADITNPASAAAVALAAGYAPLGFKGAQYIDNTESQALRRFHTKLAGRNAGPVNLMHLGDSITWGYGSLSLAGRWTSVVRDYLRAKYPNTTPVAGGFGFISYSQTFNALTYSDTPLSGTGGTVLGSNNIGPDKTGWTTGSAASRTLAFTGTGVDILYWQWSAGGSFTYSVDGGATTTVSTTGTDNTAARNQAIRSLTAGAHTVTIAWVSGTIYMGGFFTYNGDETAGIRSWTVALPGSASIYWSDATHAAWLLQMGNVVPDLVTIELGPNDLGNNTVAVFKAAVQSVIASIKTSSGYVPSFVLVPVWPLNAVSPPEPWSAFVSAMYDIATADPDGAVCVFDLQARTSSVQGTTIGGILNGDFTHPSLLGERYIGEALGGFLSPQ